MCIFPHTQNFSWFSHILIEFSLKYLKTFLRVYICRVCDERWNKSMSKWVRDRINVKQLNTNKLIYDEGKYFNYLSIQMSINFSILCFMFGVFVYCLITYWHSQWVIENVIILYKIILISKNREIWTHYSMFYPIDFRVTLDLLEMAKDAKMRT